MAAHTDRVKQLLALANRIKTREDAEKINNNPQADAPFSPHFPGAADSSGAGSRTWAILKFIANFLVCTIILFKAYVFVVQKCRLSGVLDFMLYLATALLIGLIMSWNAPQYKLLRFIVAFFGSAALIFLLLATLA